MDISYPYAAVFFSFGTVYKKLPHSGKADKEDAAALSVPADRRRRNRRRRGQTSDAMVASVVSFELLLLGGGGVVVFSLRTRTRTVYHTRRIGRRWVRYRLCSRHRTYDVAVADTLLLPLLLGRCHNRPADKVEKAPPVRHRRPHRGSSARCSFRKFRVRVVSLSCRALRKYGKRRASAPFVIYHKRCALPLSLVCCARQTVSFHKSRRRHDAGISFARADRFARARTGTADRNRRCGQCIFSVRCI